MMINLDRTRIDTRHLCERKRFWEFDFLGHGITPVVVGTPPVEVGQRLHTGMEKLLQGASVELAIGYACHGLEPQEAYLVGGALTGFVNTGRLDKLLEEYEPLEMERERSVPLVDGINLNLRLDCLARRRTDGALTIPDWKTLGNYVKSWDVTLENSLQTLLYVFAAEKHFGERIAGVHYFGFNVGKVENGERQSPYCVGYTNGDEWQVPYTGRKGWSKQPVWKGHTIESWAKVIAHTGDYDKLFQSVPPRRPLEHVMNTVVEQLVAREVLYHELLEKGDPQTQLEFRPGACYKYGTNYPCAYYGLCFGGERINEIPDGFVVRTPHHTSPDIQ